MPKTTNETIKSVIDDWMAECKTPKELMLRKQIINSQTNMQFWVMITQMSKTEEK